MEGCCSTYYGRLVAFHRLIAHLVMLFLSGDVSLSGEDEVPSISITVPGYLTSASISPSTQTPPVDHKVLEPEAEHHDQEGNDQHENHTWLLESTAVRYLLAGGVAGAGEPGLPRLPHEDEFSLNF